MLTTHSGFKFDLEIKMVFKWQPAWKKHPAPKGNLLQGRAKHQVLGEERHVLNNEPDVSRSIMIFKNSLEIIWMDVHEIVWQLIVCLLLSCPRFCWSFCSMFSFSFPVTVFLKMYYPVWLNIATRYIEYLITLSLTNSYIHIIVFIATDNQYFISKLNQNGLIRAGSHIIHVKLMLRSPSGK